MIRIEGLAKNYGRLAVLRDLDLEIPAGLITALVGPNGSGKTTLIECVLGLVHPDAGVVRVGDRVVDKDVEYRRQIGYMPQVAPFPDNLTARELVSMLADVRSHSDGLDLGLVESFGLEAEMDKPFRTLSGGTRQKVNALAAFLFRPPLLILDEPTAGLDPVASRMLKDKIQAERSGGQTFVLTSHITSEIEELAEHIVFIVEGRIRFAGAVQELKSLARETSLERAVARLMRRPSPGEPESEEAHA